MEEQLQAYRDLRRHLNSIEHMVYVSCKFTRTSEMLRRIMETIVAGYEQFFSLAYATMVSEDFSNASVHHKVQLLSDSLADRGITVDLSEYFLLKKLLISDFDSIGEYRKNLCIITYLDGEEYVINMQKLFEFYTSLKLASESILLHQ
ncbi:hypothetical protein H6501_04525 [Candidatus Woesearchaeota archaeon]|nr:hypothetical protein [Nanoarchaeota archaeon]MCB9370837.1 hypothetical protein [Candidatus Woesearchaeota archaeon]USN43937.1 MAG: hypothetical protein H6500_06125 [Candidatus Woesearchaeota archaeon]